MRKIGNTKVTTLAAMMAWLFMFTTQARAQLNADGCGRSCHTSVGVHASDGADCIGMANQFSPTLSYATGAHGTTCLSGTDLPSAAACEAAAAELGVGDRSASTEDVTDWPSGCYIATEGGGAAIL